MMSVQNYLMLRRNNPVLSFSILMSKVCSNSGGITIVKYDFELIAIADAPIECKYCILSLWIIFDLIVSAGFTIRKDSQRVIKINFWEFLSLWILFDLFVSAGFIIRKDLQRVAGIIFWEFLNSWIIFNLLVSAGFIIRKDSQGVTEINFCETNFHVFRLLSTEDFTRTIKRRTEDERSKEYDASMRMLIPQLGEKLWGEKRIGNKVDMIAEMVGFRPRINTGRDAICMDSYLSAVSKDGLDHPTMLQRDQFLPVGAPLLDYLVENSRNSEGWKYPKLEDLTYYQANRGLSLEMLKQVEVRELVCGVSSKEEILDVIQWVKRMHSQDQERFGTQVISLDVEDVKATFYDTLRMAGKIQISGGRIPLRTQVEKDVVYGYLKDGWRQIPGKIMFGNGITWTCLVSLDLEQDERSRYLVRRMEVQPEILSLLRDLPVSAGLAIRRDLQGVEEFYSLISGEDVKLERGFLDLTTLAILAGYKFHSKNMTAMGVQVMGTLLNKTVSTGDNLWGLRWDRIPNCLQCYALGDIKFGFITYNVLAGLLLRDLFPDPDVVCRFLECNQITAVNWFLEFVLCTLEGVSYHQIAEEQAQTREDMIRSLRLRDGKDKLCDSSPSFVKLWLELLGSWPSVTFGGCRFLLQSREWFLVQIRVLVRAQIKWSDGRILRSPREDDLEYSRFGLSAEEIGDQTWMNSISSIWGMVRPAGVKIPLLEFDISSTKPCEIGRRCTVLGRCQRWSLLEWARLNPDRLKLFFVRMIRDAGFQTHYANMLDAMRLCYRRLFDSDAPKVKKVEVLLNNGVQKSCLVETVGLEKAELEVKVRQERVKYLKELGQDWTFKERTRWTVEVPVLPSWKPRKDRKRMRSPSKSRSGTLKKKSRRSRSVKRSRSVARVGPPGVESSVQSVSQPDPGESGVRNGFTDQNDELLQEEEREDVVLLNEDDLEMEQDELTPGPSSSVDQVSDLKTRNGSLGSDPKCKRLSSALKSSEKRRVLTYDELIEGTGRSESAYDDLDFEFEIPKEVEDIEI